MKKLTLLLSGLLLSAATLLAQTTKWQSDPAHSKLSFGIQHSGISEVDGRFGDFEAIVFSDKADFSDAKFDLKVATASINTDIEMRDNHLKSPDFFDVEKYPAMTFESTGLKKAGKDRYQLSGNLTMHGITKPVTMDLWYRGTIDGKDGKKIAGFQLTGAIKRSDFGIGEKFAPPMLSDEVKIKADGEFVRQ